MQTVIWTVVAILAILAVATFAVLWRHNPFRKWVLRKIDRTWEDRARVADFPPDRIAEEEADMFVSSTVMRDACDVIWEEFDEEPPANLTGPHPYGTVIWVNTKRMPRFIEEFLPKMQSKFVLVSARENNPTRYFDVDRVLADPNVLCWFVENYEFDASYIETGKIVPLPLGMNYHKLDPNSPNRAADMGAPARPGAQQAQLRQIRDTISPIRERPLKVYCNFQLNMDTFLRHHHAIPRAEARAEAIEALKDKPFAIVEPRQTTRNDVWRRHEEAAFEASPRGNSIDCHRTWEALLLRTIPIVKTTPMDPIYDGLPVVIVQDWSEVTEANLAKWRDEYAPWFDAPLPPVMFSNHWIARFHSWKSAETRPRIGGTIGAIPLPSALVADR
ncbi:hypothetical protein ATO6_06185 [Oceanicola sp. 22II-s10i]|uniref:hypothetical protein n=1 Tax=Oceanicola sp. 22II-s10i TaxID=1317116 RepID=UPI000B51E7DD|nr:hypothetical protein [Oceanicola sp. 22II-s10i]OWU86401.1 hypothetical protein ATO6_06185 [Oceanicola sp. 22II-s10i]